MDPVERFKQLQHSSLDLQQKVSRAEGALSQHLARLRDEHGCGSLESARKKLKQLEKQAQEAVASFQKAADEFEEKWTEQLNER